MRKILLATLIFAVVGVMAQEKSLQQLGGVYYAYPIESGVAMPDIPEGLGLGLPLAKRHAVGLGGDLLFDTTYQEGCRAIIEVPK